MFCFLFSRWLLRPFVGCTQNALQNYKKFSIYASTKCMPQHFSAILAVKRTDYNLLISYLSRTIGPKTE